MSYGWTELVGPERVELSPARVKSPACYHYTTVPFWLHGRDSNSDLTG